MTKVYIPPTCQFFGMYVETFKEILFLPCEGFESISGKEASQLILSSSSDS
jgi:hypothetical protein